MNYVLALALSLLSFAGPKIPNLPVPEEKLVIGATLPELPFIAEGGRRRSLAELSGGPLVVLPIYTSCGGVCPTIARSLKAAALAGKDDLSSYRVFVFSFDPRDTLADLEEFKRQQRLPAAWTLGRLEPENIQKLTDAMDFRVSRRGHEWVHPNAVAFFNGERKLVKFLYGTKFSPGAFEGALEVTRGATDWEPRLLPYGIGLSALCLLFSVAWFVHLLSVRKNSVQNWS